MKQAEERDAQGGVASPLLANLYCTVRRLFYGRRGRLGGGMSSWCGTRRFCGVSETDGDRDHRVIESRLEGKFQLEINRDKTHVVHLREKGASLTFLGYTFRYDRDLKGRDGRNLNMFREEGGPTGKGEGA